MEGTGNEAKPDSSLEAISASLMNDDDPEVETSENVVKISEPKEVKETAPAKAEELSIQSNQEESGVSESVLEEHIDQAVNRFVAPPAELVGQIMQLLNKRRVNCIVNGDYDGAEWQDRCVKFVTLALQMEQEKQNEDHRIDLLYERYQSLQMMYEEISQRYDNKIAAFMNDENSKRHQMIEKHEQEMREFEAKWADPSSLRPFNKPSTRLLQMREQEKSMAISRMYAQAKEMKILADKLQKEETAAAQAKIATQIAIDREKLKDRQEKELSAFDVHTERSFIALNKAKERSTLPYVTAMQQIKLKKPLSANQNLFTRTRAETPLESPLSPRTQELYATFKAEKRRSNLDVAPVEAKTAGPTPLRKSRTSLQKRPTTTLSTATRTFQ